MKRVVIVAPYFPPNNLTGVHRSRYLASHLREFGWEPLVLTVRPEFYKEDNASGAEELLPKDLRVIRTKAFKPSFIIADISIRSFFWHWAELRRLAKNKEIDFVFISLFPAYSTLLGRLIWQEFKIPYAIDYQDPWIMYHPKKVSLFSKEGISGLLARILEPFAVGRVSLLTSVADSYLEGVISRNIRLKNVPKLVIPIGFDPLDADAAMERKPYLFKEQSGKLNFVYAGAMLPYGFGVLRKFFEALVYLRSNSPELFSRIMVYFIGTGKSCDDKHGYNIKPIAEEYGLYNQCIYEYPARIPYLDALAHINKADVALVLGSDEKHYMPSKIFPAVLFKKPVLAILHNHSPALKLLRESGAGIVSEFSDDSQLNGLAPRIAETIKIILEPGLQQRKVNYSVFDELSASAIAKKLAAALNTICQKK